jgi:hypothetical protein
MRYSEGQAGLLLLLLLQVVQILLSPGFHLF